MSNIFIIITTSPYTMYYMPAIILAVHRTASSWHRVVCTQQTNKKTFLNKIALMRENAASIHTLSSPARRRRLPRSMCAWVCVSPMRVWWHFLRSIARQRHGPRGSHVMNNALELPVTGYHTIILRTAAASSSMPPAWTFGCAFIWQSART